jgi:hypothetical protein
VKVDKWQKASPHDILQGWQDGEITTERALTLTARENVEELLQAAISSGVEIRFYVPKSKT